MDLHVQFVGNFQKWPNFGLLFLYCYKEWRREQWAIFDQPQLTNSTHVVWTKFEWWILNSIPDADEFDVTTQPPLFSPEWQHWTSRCFQHCECPRASRPDGSSLQGCTFHSGLHTSSFSSSLHSPLHWPPEPCIKSNYPFESTNVMTLLNTGWLG